MEKTTIIHLPLSEKLFKVTREAAQKRGFGSLEEFILWLLKKELQIEDEEAISEEEKERIKEKLKKLGYLE